MKVEKTEEIDQETRSKKKRKESEEEVEEAEKAAGSSAKKKVKPSAAEEEAPLARKKGSAQAMRPSHPPSPEAAKEAELAPFKADEIETFAWEEEAEEAKKAKPLSTGAPSVPARAEFTSPPATEEAASEVPKEAAPGTPPMASAPPPQLHFESEEDFRKEEIAPPAEEWPQTSSFLPSAAFRSHEPDQPPPRPKEPIPSRSAPKGTEEWPGERERERPEPEAAQRPQGKKKAAPKQAPPPPGTPGKKGEPASFAELMEEEEKLKTAGKKPVAKGKTPREEAAAGAKAPVPHEEKGAPPISVGKPAPSGAGSVPSPIEGAPLASPPSVAKELPPSALQGILPSEEGFPSLKKTAHPTISPEKAEEGEAAAAQFPSLPEKGAGGGEREGKREREEEEEIEQATPPVGAAPSGITPALPPVQTQPPLHAYTQMNPQILALFERMVGVMTIIKTTGITETVMTLNARQFASSVLYGSQLVIREFSTAPTAFNVEFIGSPAALALIQPNIASLLGAVQQGNFNFTINRFDVKLGSTEKPIFSRKEAPSEKDAQEKEHDTP